MFEGLALSACSLSQLELTLSGVPRKTSKPRPDLVHIQDERFEVRTLCGKPWRQAKGGRVASNTDPPVVTNERGSVYPLSCKACLLIWNQKQARKVLDEKAREARKPKL